MEDRVGDAVCVLIDTEDDTGRALREPRVDTPGVFRPSNTTFFFRHTNTQGNADSTLVFGESPWLPVAGTFGLD